MTIFSTREHNITPISPVDVQHLLKQSYWANTRTLETVETSMKNSYCFGFYDNDDLIAFGRVVSDYATFYYICDIIVDEAHRGKGLGKQLNQHIQAHPVFKALKGFLATGDAHGLYEQYGFTREPEKFMVKRVDL